MDSPGPLGTPSTPTRPRTSRRPAIAAALLATVTLAASWAPRPPPSASILPIALNQPVRPEAQEVVVTLRGGRIVQGLLARQDPNEIVLRIAGVDTPFPRRDIEAIRSLPPVRERYHAMRAAIEPNDVDGLVLLAEWLRERELYDEALQELAPVLELEPFNTRARELHRWLTAQVQLLKRKADPAARPTSPQAQRPGQTPSPTTPPATRPVPRLTPTDPFPTLTPDQINVIRVYEVDLGNPPRMRVDREVVEEFIRAYASSDQIPATRVGRDQLLNAPARDVLGLMFKLQAREFYPRVRVLEDPASIRMFKDRLHGSAGWLTNACATTRCHGGAEAGRLYLQARRPNSDATVYTNLLILDRFRLADGTPLIDYDRPTRSPLLHMGMVRDVSLYPHPEVPGLGGPGWRAVFRGTDDRQFQRAVEWIGAMYRPRIPYPVEYEPPVPPAVQEEGEDGVTDPSADPAADPSGHPAGAGG